MLCPGYISVFVYLLILHKQVLGSCPTNCAKCSENGDSPTCDKCIYGHWLTNEVYCLACPDNCEHCTSSSQCTKCKSEFWDIRPNMVCGSPCDETCTNSGCNDTTGYCFGCYPGYYGPFCDQSCELCTNKSCTGQRCKIGCINGYYGNADGFECKRCSDHCWSCVSNTNCTKCEKGYYLFRYENNDFSFCTPCNPACVECISYSECVCESGKYGPTCNKECNISNCKSCIDVDSVVKCTECINGYAFLNGYCILETNLCSQYCSNGCDSNQNCLDGCENGWTGQKCTERCAAQCGKCSQNDAKNCKICKGDFFTETCTHPCSLHCSAFPDSPRCNIDNGTCLNGCDKDYWGDKCDNRCYEGCNSGSCYQPNGFCDLCNRTHYGNSCQSKCSEHCVDNDASSTICYKTNGTCIGGCKDGYGGNTCEDEMAASTMVSSSTAGKNDENDKSDSFAKIFLLGMLAGVGVCLLSLVAFVAVRQIKQRRKQPNGSQIGREERPYVNTAVTMQAVSSTVTECSTKNIGSNNTSDETSRSVYDSLDGDKRDDRHLYSGLERPTDRHGTSYANL